MFIDIHAHVRIFDSPSSPDDYGSLFCTPVQLREKLEPFGVNKAIVLPCVTPDCSWGIQSNEEILWGIREHADFFVPFMNLDPRMGSNSPQSNLGYFMDHYKAQGCRGIGEITANLPFDDPLMENLFHHAELKQLPVIFHIAPSHYGYYGIRDGLHLPGLEGALQKFPNLIFIGHSQPFWAEIGGDLTAEQRNSYPTGPVAEGGTLVRLLRSYPNLWADLSAGSGFNAVSRDPEFGFHFFDEFQDRLMFGTDVCDIRNEVKLPDYLKTSLAANKISQSVFNKIAHENAHRLLNL